MSLLNVRVKKARFVGVQAQQFNNYVTLKLQNVKSTTVTVKGANPCWEQDFVFETNDINTGLLVEVWSKGMVWDRALGYHYIPLPGVPYANEDGCGQWVSLDSELEMRGGEVVGTKSPTGHSLLIACRFEQPFDPENTAAADLQRKLEMLNSTMDQETRAEQARRQTLYNIGHSGYSEDSDYTSDLNYPVGGQGANSSASQFRTAANQLATPQRSLETSRENSYERDDQQLSSGGRLMAGNYANYGSRGHSPRYDEPYPGESVPQRYSQQNAESSEPLSYNSRPRGYKEYRRRKHTWDYEDSQDGWYSEGYDHPSTRIDDTRIYSDTEYYPSTTGLKRRDLGPHRKPSLERQTTLYDEHHYNSDYNNDQRIKKMNAVYPECQTDIIHNDYYNTGYMYYDERYGQDDEDRQWDSGGKWYLGSSTYYENKRNRKTLPQRPASSIGIHRPNYRPTVTRQRSYESEELDYSGTSRRRKNQRVSRQEGTGKKLPPTPTKPSNVILSRKPVSLPATPGRQLPRTQTPSEESYYKQDYNEDYNYAYRSSQDNLPHDGYLDSNVYGSQEESVEPYNNYYKNQKETTDSYSNYYNGSSQDNQYVSNYVTQDQYSANYTSEAVDYYANDSYQDSYPAVSQSLYQENTYSYQENTYPEVSKEYEGSKVIEDNYQSCDDQSYKDESYQQQSYKEDNNTTNQYDNTAQYNNAVQYNDAVQYDNTVQYNNAVQYDDSVQYDSSAQYDNTVQYDNTAQYNNTAQYDDSVQYDTYEYTAVSTALDNNYGSNYQEPYVNSVQEVPELTVSTPKGKTTTNGYQSESEYYYPSADEDLVATSARKRADKRDISPLLQQHTDSLESKDDELKDSFDTAVSSIASNQVSKAFDQYSVEEPSPITATSVDSAADDLVHGSSVTTTAAVHSTAIVNGKRSLARSESYVEEVVGDDEYPEMLPPDIQRKDSQLSHQSQASQRSNQKPKLSRGDSYVSDHFDDQGPGRRESFVQRQDSYGSETQDSFKPSLSRADSYQQREFSRSSAGYGQNFTAPQPISRAESYQRGYFKDQESIDETEIVLSSAINGEYKMSDETLERYERGEEALTLASRENSLVEPYKTSPPLSRSASPRGSITKQTSLDESVQMDTPPRSPPEPPADEELLEMVGVQPVPTQLKERPEMTAKQRWHWAYNKIIMQLNVSISHLVAMFQHQLSSSITLALSSPRAFLLIKAHNGVTMMNGDGRLGPTVILIVET